ncbi:hypothetical protein B566_EDAN004869 [Ephemera danica]|nr:hypothetical protein B566_EDAN004869 [Ephemera danica]
MVDMGVIPLLIKGVMDESTEGNIKQIEASLCCLRTLLQSGLAPHAAATLCQDDQLLQHLLNLLHVSVTNQTTITTMLTAACKAVPELLVSLMAQDKPVEMQLASARCLTYLHRAGAMGAEDPKIVYKTLPCLAVPELLVSLMAQDKPVEMQLASARCLTYLHRAGAMGAEDPKIRLASISNHLIPTLASFLRAAASETGQNQLDMRQSAFRAFASLGANDEDIRKKIIDTEGLMDHVVSGLQDGSPGVRLAAIRCLHSLSRSVQQLRTTFQVANDHSVWRPLMQLLQGSADDDILTVASSTLCNLLLEFSPSKEPILELGAIDLLCGLTRRKDPALRLNGIWALMNMAFQAEQKIKSQILKTLGTDQIFRLLSDPEAVILILEGNHGAEVKEQALCILANIADGESAKDFIMTNEDVLKKLASYMGEDCNDTIFRLMIFR